MPSDLENEIEASAPSKKLTPPRSRTVKSLQDVQLPGGDDTTDAREAALETADRKAIDDIVLSNDVSKGGKIRVTRKGPFDHNYQYVTTIPADSWDTDTSFEFIKKLYGGGDYKCQTFRANGQMYKPFEFAIDHRVKGQLDEDSIKQLATEQQTGRSSSSSDMLKMFELFKPAQPSDQLKSSDLIKIMEMGSQKSDQMMIMMMQMMNKSSENMVQMMTVMMTANASKGGIDPVLLQMLQAKQEKTPVLELLEMMKAIKELNAPEKDEPEKPLWERLLTGVAPALIGGLTGGQPLPVQTQVSEVTQPQQPQKGSESTQIDQPTADMLNNYLVRIFLNKVLSAATENKDPALYADMISETLSPEQFQMLRGVLTQADWAVKLFGQDQRVQGCMEWLTELKTLILTDELPQSPTATTGGSSTVPDQK
jgi:hypothetical protein